MLILCLSYASVMLLLCCCCCFIVLLLCFYWNKILTQSVSKFFHSHFLKEEYVSKELFIKAMVCSKKRQRIEEVPHGVCLNTWLRAVQEAAFVLGKIETKKVTSPRARSRSVLQDNLLALEIKALPKDANIDVLIADTPNGERNLNPTKNQLSIECPSYGLSNSTKTFFVANNWWDIHPKNSDGTSNLLSVHWSSYFKGLYDKKNIPLVVMKMADNRLRMVFCHHQ